MSAETEASPPPASKKFFRGLLETLAIIVIAILISTALKTWVVRSFYIPSGSMETTLQIDDRVLVNQLAPRFGPANRGDIIVFDDPDNWLSAAETSEYQPNPFLEFIGLAPSDAGNQLIKRVIGVGGDKVECCDAEGRLMVNGKPIDETYLDEGMAPSEMEFSVTVPEGHYWVMGDNRSNSADSRYHEDTDPFVSEDDLVGTVFLINWPFKHFGWVSNPEDVFAGVPEPEGITGD
ncbi:signal peptidase I [Brevibacterium sp. GP-SGM9]|uniref:signal peptidase I n=1 Tax=unclassified Brevibacterium TaxID=2614124 RepID=UPI001E500955|nr:MULTISPECIES: signal peptidase I [unclassified Brevibacterium]MCD1285907.1 signal peptidase I [Brevibacterium sp. CCUG 69071]MDK8434971.1 signal peptidase I [Brevibacterium sp. H-BE7]